ncbi:PH domain-containing protein [uncultured Mucilaginibacter sp.]|uniref:PH domain-containing protein n=1 Tax=uncultured Mucilaginibacter sp. TaxID=797541 RepID=UPI002634762A|nr:PH domain-containing protein [uncultured Mucilaginibacter sp.]
MIEQFLKDQQEPKAVEKVYSRLNDLLNSGEEIIYIAVQKKPLVNITPDCVAITNKRIFFFTAANFGLSIKFMDFVWKDVVEVKIKEELLGAVFSIKTLNGAETSVDFLPKVQARKLYQYGQEREQAEREERRQRDLEEKRAASGTIHTDLPRFASTQNQPEPIAAPKPVETPKPAEEVKPDELTAKLKKLKMLFDNGLITQEEYNQKKLELLSEL